MTELVVDVSSRACPWREIRGQYDADSIIVYQAFSAAIAEPAVAAGRFVPPFSLSRMTWIKPSFLWMMYRSGWASKPGQERVLAIRISRRGFECALAQSCLSHFERPTYLDREAWAARRDSSPVRVQWDPERDLASRPLPWRSIQIGLSGGAVVEYVNTWTLAITDITTRVLDIRAGLPDTVRDLPQERPYPVSEALAQIIGLANEGPA